MRRTHLVGLLVAMALTAPASPAPAAPRPDTVTQKEPPMFLETTRIITDWLNNGTYGVNAKLAALPKDVGDNPPAVQLIVDETRNGVAARERIPVPGTAGPVITVHIARPAIVHTELADAYRDVPDLPVVIRYADTNQVASDVGTRNAMYTMRAVLQSINALMGAPGDGGARERNQVAIANVKDEVQAVPVFQDVEDKVITGGLVFSFYVRDKLP